MSVCVCTSCPPLQQWVKICKFQSSAQAWAEHPPELLPLPTALGTNSGGDPLPHPLHCRVPENPEGSLCHQPSTGRSLRVGGRTHLVALGPFGHGCGEDDDTAPGSWQRWWQQVTGERVGFCLQGSEDVGSERGWMDGWRRAGAAQNLWGSLGACAQSNPNSPKVEFSFLRRPGERYGLRSPKAPSRGRGQEPLPAPSSPSAQKVEETLLKASASGFLKLLLDSVQMNLNWKVLQAPDGAGICSRKI